MKIPFPITTTPMTAIAAVTAEGITMVDVGVYTEKMSIFSRMLRREGMNISPQETADACQILIHLGLESREQVNVRELHGYTPWYFLEMAPEYDTAWRLLSDPEGFAAPSGLTSAEQCHPGFVIAREGHECQWNGPVWPFATSVTLTGLARLLHCRQPESVGKLAYFSALMTYTRSHYLTENDQTIPWIDENMDPYNGSWLARELLLKKDPVKIPERGKDYSHSTFADLVITGLCGLQSSLDGGISAHPLLPEKSWDYFLLDGVPVHGHSVSVQFDRDGSRYGRGAGLTLYVDGAAVDHCKEPGGRVYAK